VLARTFDGQRDIEQLAARLLAKKSFIAIINMTYSWRVRFAMIHTERERKVFPAKDRVKALFDPSMKWQLVEEYGVDSFTEQDDGSLLFEREYADDEGLLAWMLSCRDMVTVLEPEQIREKLYQITSEIAKRYEGERE